jgi:stalled ribosome alternative rescue factor ArfA
MGAQRASPGHNEYGPFQRAARDAGSGVPQDAAQRGAAGNFAACGIRERSGYPQRIRAGREDQGNTVSNAICAICKKELFYSYQEHKKGKTAAQIRAGIVRGDWSKIDLTQWTGETAPSGGGK